MKNYISIALVAVIVGLIVGYLVHSPGKLVGGAVGPVGGLNQTTSWSSISFAPTGANGTSTSILNNGATDRSILGTYVACTGTGSALNNLGPTGVGVSSWGVYGATTTVANQGVQNNTNYFASTTIATTTAGYTYVATTTEGVLQYVSRYWPVNTNITFVFTSTSTAACALGVEWIPL